MFRSLVADVRSDDEDTEGEAEEKGELEKVQEEQKARENGRPNGGKTSVNTGGPIERKKQK